VFDGLKSVEMLRTLRNLRDDIFTATKREGTRWLFEDYEAEAYAWMEGVTAKICSMNYSPDEFLKDVVEFRELMERPPKKIAGLDWLRLNDLFDAVINKVKDVWMSATISSSSSSSKSSGDRGVPAFAFRDPLDGSVIDIVTDTARAMANVDPRPAPSSATETTACVAPSSSSTSNVTVISSLANFTALDSKLRSTEFIFTVSTSATASSDVLPRGGTPWVLSQKVSLTLRASADT
jgi:hypothetical protein